MSAASVSLANSSPIECVEKMFFGKSEERLDREGGRVFSGAQLYFGFGGVGRFLCRAKGIQKSTGREGSTELKRAEMIPWCWWSVIRTFTRKPPCFEGKVEVGVGIFS